MISFYLGGDSIKMIWVVSILSQKNLKVKMSDIYAARNIRSLAKMIHEDCNTADQDTLTGDVELNAIQRWFFQNHTINPSHFHQSIMLKCADRLDPDALKTIFEMIQANHDALRATFNTEKGKSFQHIHDLSMPVDFKTVYFSSEDDCREKLKQTITQTQEEVDLQKGPLMHSRLFSYR